MLIPPLPSHTAGGKENDRQPKNVRTGSTLLEKFRKVAEPAQAPTAATNTTRLALGLLTPQCLERRDSLIPQSSSRIEGGILFRSPCQAPSTSIKPPPSGGTRRRVLRYGETMEVFFCLSSNCSEEHVKLCQEITDGSLADDVTAWRRVLKIAINLAEKRKTGKNDIGTDLIRLHRRATVRFPIDIRSQEQTQQDVVAMWLLYAQVQAKYSSADEARMTYRHIQNQQLAFNASFYLALADFEKDHDISKAEAALRLGIQEKAEPLQDLQQALEKLTESNKALPSSSLFAMIPPLPPRKDGASRISRTQDDEQSPKRIRTDAGAVEVPEKKTQLANSGEQNELNPSDATKRNEISRLGSKRPLSDIATNSVPNSDDLPKPKRPHKSASSTSLLKSIKPAQVTVSSASSCRRLSGDRGKRPGLLSKTTRLGKAKRVDPETSMIVDKVESDSEQDTNGVSDTPDLVGKASRAPVEPVPSINKLDLNYMWEWDPTSRGQGQNKTPRSSSSSSPTTKGASVNTNSTDSTTASSLLFSDKRSILPEEEAPAEEKNLPPKEPEQLLARQSSAEQGSLLGQLNIDFLPLVNQHNIVPVNGVPYAKLGVIGKGGSCKVYRALSKDCSVLAIKKVKLDGMDRKAIEGYANEISLLKRLRGNPAIIQMYDSEVDLARKAIFVVMELGEVDLNQVLQQQAIAAGKNPSKQRRSLNMNFIRLTWQQMLSAVHSIHDERIIHSDLKPANFLFVRGALKLIDFGIAKAIQTDDTQNVYRESQVGTLNYMSPEAILVTGSENNGRRHRIGKVCTV
jgi:hypothetical protein